MAETVVDLGEIDQLGSYLCRAENVPRLNEKQRLGMIGFIRAGLEAQSQLGGGSTDSDLLDLVRQGQEALDSFVKGNLGLVVSIAGRYTRDRGDFFSELVQEGTVALIRATKSFRPELGNAFSTYAGRSIERACSTCVTNNAAGPASMSYKVARKLASVRWALDDLGNDEKSSSAQEYVAGRLGVTTEEAYKLISLLPVRESAQPDRVDPDTGTSIYENTRSTSDTEGEVLLRIPNTRLKAAVKRLPDDERTALVDYLDLDETTDSSTRGSMSRTAQRALSMLRHPSMAYFMKDVSDRPDDDSVELGECAYIGLEAFFFGNNRWNEAIKRVCGSCALRDRCLDTALKHAELGVWGGLSENERAALRRQSN